MNQTSTGLRTIRPLVAGLVACALLSSSQTLKSAGREYSFVENVRLTLDSGRPLADGVRALETACGCVITYEDPLYVHASEISDVTESVRRDLDKYKPGEAPRVLVPRGGQFDFEYDPRVLRVDPEKVVRELVAAYATKLNAAEFRVQTNGRAINVIPTAYKNARGNSTVQRPVLDTIISPPALTKSQYQLVTAICSDISRATGTKVVVGGTPLNRIAGYQASTDTKPRKARDMLLNILGPGLSWQLFYGPGSKMYVLNIHTVP